MKSYSSFICVFFFVIKLINAQNLNNQQPIFNYLSIINCSSYDLINPNFIERYNALEVPIAFYKPSEIVGLNNSSKLIFSYNKKGLITSEEYYEADSLLGLRLSYQRLFTYNSDWKILSVSYLSGNGGCTLEEFYEYDNYRRLINILKKQCDNEFEKYEYTYYENGKIKGIYYYRKYANWVAKNGTEYTYDSNLNLLTVTNFSEKDHALAYSSKIIYTYTTNNLLLTQLEQSYDNNEWTDVRYFTLEYDSLSQLIHKIEFIKNNTNWREEYHYYYEYNNYGSLLKYTQKRWVPYAWILNYQELFTYDENQLMLYKTTKIGDGFGNGIYELKTSRTYNNFGQISSETLFKYINGCWNMLDSTIYEFDDNLNCIKAANYGFENGNLLYTPNLLNIFYNHSSDCLVLYNEYVTINYILINDINENDFSNDNFSLENNYPNPFNPSTTISFNIPNSGLVSLKIYNSIGMEIESLINQELPAGKHFVIWNAKDNASGIYFYKLSTGKYSLTKKMCLIK